MSVANLDKLSRAIIYRCLEAILSSDFIDDDNEFATRIGLPRERVRQVLLRWPSIQDDDQDSKDGLAINNTLNEFSYGLTIAPDMWRKWFTFKRSDLEKVFAQWRRSLEGRSG